MPISFEHYFPLGLASGEAFIERKESEWLIKNIHSGIHTLLMAPRRYGKSSLVLHILEKNHLNYIEMDLQLCRTAKAVEQKIIHSIEKIISQISKKPETLLKIAQSFFQKTHWKISFKGFVELSIEPEKQEDIVENMLTAFQFLETVLMKENKKVVFFIDEVQEIQLLKEAYEIQGAIRHFAQKTKQVAFIFSGSNRRLLRTIFDDSVMPLYQLCDTMILNKIEEKAYAHYLNEVALCTWHHALPEDVFHEIIALTHRHPRRIYHLCFYLWRNLETQKTAVSTVESVREAWQMLIQSSLKGIRYYLAQRNNSQLKVLAYIALGNHTELTGKVAQKTTDLSSTGIMNALNALVEENFIEQNSDGTYAFIDPLVQAAIATYETELLT